MILRVNSRILDDVDAFGFRWGRILDEVDAFGLRWGAARGGALSGMRVFPRVSACVRVYGRVSPGFCGFLRVSPGACSSSGGGKGGDRACSHSL